MGKNKGKGRAKQRAKKTSTPYRQSEAQGTLPAPVTILASHSPSVEIPAWRKSSKHHVLLVSTPSVHDRVLRVCELVDKDTELELFFSTHKLIICGFKLYLQIDGAMSVFWYDEIDDEWLIEDEDRKRELLVPDGYAGELFNAAGSITLSDLMSCKERACEGLCIEEIEFSLGELYALRLFTDDNLWEALRPIRENIDDRDVEGFEDWRSILHTFCNSRDKFRNTVHTIIDLTSKKCRIVLRIGAAMLEMPGVMDWMLAETVLLDRRAGREGMMLNGFDIEHGTDIVELIEMIKAEERGRCYVAYENARTSVFSCVFSRIPREQLVKMEDLKYDELVIEV
jgi:hypothetical protein